MAHALAYVNTEIQDNLPRKAFVATKWQGDLSATPSGGICTVEPNAATITLAKSTIQYIGKSRDLSTGNIATGANESHFNFMRYVLPGGYELRRLYDLARTLDPRRQCFIAGDLITSEASLNWAPRLMKAKVDSETGETIAPTLCDRPSRLVALDLDNMPTPEGFDYNCRDALADLVKAHLPVFARETEMLICATASNGFKAGSAAARVFMLTDRALSLAEKKSLFGDYVKAKRNPNPQARIDGALFTSTQPIFVGAHFTSNGGLAVDPFAWVRFFMRNPDGAPIVVDDSMLFEDAEEIVETATGVAVAKVKRLRAVDSDDVIPWSNDFDAELTKMAEAEDWSTAAGVHHQTITCARAAYRQNPFARPAEVAAAIRKAIEARFTKAAKAGHARDAATIAERLADVDRQVEDAERAYGMPSRRFGTLPAPAPTMTADEAAEALKAPIDRVIAAAVKRSAWHATPVRRRTLEAVPETVRAIARVSVGVGKSAYAIRRLAEEIEKAHAERRFGFRVLYVVPTHRLAKEVVSRFEALGVKAARYQSPFHIPDDPADDRCRVPGLLGMFKDAAGAQADFCATCIREVGPCRIGSQDYGRASVVVIAGPALFSALPAATRRADYARNVFAPEIAIDDDDGFEMWMSIDREIVDTHFDLIICDEAPVTSWLAEEPASASDFLADLEKLDVSKAIPGTGAKVDERRASLQEALAELAKATAFVRPIIQGLVDARAENEPADDTDFIAVPSHRWYLIRRAALRILERPDVFMARAILLKGDDPRHASLAALAHASRAWRNLAECMLPRDVDGARGTVTVSEPSRTGAVTLTMCWRPKLHKDVRDIPLLILDATANKEVLERFIPGSDFVSIEAKDGPHVVRRFWKEDASDRVVDDPKRLKRLVEGVLKLSGEFKGLITSKKGLAVARAHFPREIGAFEVAQYAALRGLNSLERVDHLTLIGRPFPSYEELRNVAIKLFGRHLAEREGFMRDPTREMCPVWVRDRATGLLRPEYVPVLWHPLPELRHVIRLIRDDEIVQADGRARAVRRLDDLTIDHFTHTLTPGLVWDAVDMELAHARSISAAVLELAATGFAASHRNAWAAELGLTPKQIEDWSRRDDILGCRGRDFLREQWENAIALDVPMLLASVGRLKIAGTKLEALHPARVHRFESRMLGALNVVF